MGNETKACDCLGWCGDDSDLAKGLVVPCELKAAEDLKRKRRYAAEEMLKELGHPDFLSALEALKRLIQKEGGNIVTWPDGTTRLITSSQQEILMMAINKMSIGRVIVNGDDITNRNDRIR